MRLLAPFAAFLLVSFATAEDTPAVRKLELKAVKLKHESKTPQVSEIGSAEALSKSKLFADDASREAVSKQVDFTKEKLIVSAWTGSGSDSATTEIEKGEVWTVKFVYEAGKTDDVKPHGYVFVVPKTAKILNVVQESCGEQQ
ncbi:MAG: hypothetical protein U0792_08755 [Gemmataceae bacterium]